MSAEGGGGGSQEEGSDKTDTKTNGDRDEEQMSVDDVAIADHEEKSGVGAQESGDNESRKNSKDSKQSEEEEDSNTKSDGKQKKKENKFSNSSDQTEKDSKRPKSVDSDITEGTEEYTYETAESNSDSLQDTLDTFYGDQDVDDCSDSGSEKEIKALKANMGNSKSKKSYQDSSSDEYEEKWGKPWRSKNDRKQKPYSFAKRWSEKDTEEYRKGYPKKKDSLSKSLNLKFYTNKVQSRPDGDFIDDIHKKWWGDHHLLEVHHGYIQWLFPIRESGMNFHAQELQLHEAEGIRENRLAQKRVLQSYKMMLDFYGMDLKDEATGELQRAENWKERFAHLNRSMHNYLRITRILKSLGELGFERLKFNFVKFVLEEAIYKKTLNKTVNSCYNYWIETIKDDDERDKLKTYADELMSKE